MTVPFTVVDRPVVTSAAVAEFVEPPRLRLQPASLAAMAKDQETQADCLGTCGTSMYIRNLFVIRLAVPFNPSYTRLYIGSRESSRMLPDSALQIGYLSCQSDLTSNHAFVNALAARD